MQRRVLRPAAALHVRWIIDVGSSIDYDAGEVLGQEPGSRGISAMVPVGLR